MLFEVKNRFTSSVQFTADIQCDDTASYALKLGLAVRWGLANRADLRGAYLVGADLRGAYLVGADLRGAYLVGADLVGADLGGADLGGAYLGGAKIDGENIAKKLVCQIRHSSGYHAFAWITETGFLLKAGCQSHTTFESAASFIENTASIAAGKSRQEARDILDFLRKRIEAELID